MVLRNDVLNVNSKCSIKKFVKNSRKQWLAQMVKQNGVIIIDIIIVPLKWSAKMVVHYGH
jgi:hypothetical protein